MQFVIIAIGIVSLICWILMLVKIFQSGDTLWGVLSICPLVCFIYGWVKVGKLNAQPIMLAWTVAVVLNIVLNLAFPPTGNVVVP
jgi:hypothetical protein